MTRGEILAFLPSCGVEFFGGLNYAVGTVANVTGPVYAGFKARYWSVDLNAWSVKWECRDFARAFACYCQECNARTNNTPEAEDAFAVGEFWFVPDGAEPGQGHAINVCILDGKLVFIEPQLGTVRPTSQNEILRRTFVRW